MVRLLMCIFLRYVEECSVVPALDLADLVGAAIFFQMAVVSFMVV